MGNQDLIGEFFIDTMLSTGHSLGLEPEQEINQRICPAQLDDETINAYLLGKLGEAEKRIVDNHLYEEGCEECIRRVEEASLFLGITRAEAGKSRGGE
ncbi:zf-HC2 domain-containing protein [Candidatus Woesearchaeota archaeon]|nr:zf-HC2 domain-containing protein [Candidatus Woesearchaeota archaeon]